MLSQQRATCCTKTNLKWCKMVDASVNETIGSAIPENRVTETNSKTAVKITNLPRNTTEHNPPLETDVIVKAENMPYKNDTEPHNRDELSIKQEIDESIASESMVKQSELIKSTSTVKVEGSDARIKVEVHDAHISDEISIKEESNESTIEDSSVDGQATDYSQNHINFNDIKLRLNQKLNVKDTEIYKCDLCSFTSIKSKSVLTHKKVHKIHTIEKSYACPLCDFKTAWMNSIDYHVKIHRVTEHLVCLYCDFKTASRQNFRTHMRIHKKEKCKMVFKCKDCPYIISSKQYMQRHVERQGHANEFDEIYKCEECDFSSSLKRVIEWHSRMHTGKNLYECVECEYKTHNSSNFNKHRRLHDKKRSIVR